MDVKTIMESFSKQHTLANEVSEVFSQFVWENPQKALDELFNWYDNALNKAYTDKEGNNARYFVEAIAGGPHEAIPAALYNSVGAIYPFLDRKTKNTALHKILNILDGINSQYVQLSHTSYIREPLLLSDISTVRPIYWPGLDEGKRKINECKVFPDFKIKYMHNGFFKKEMVDSDFIIAYSLLRNDLLEWGDAFVEVVNPSFLDRVLEGIITMCLTLNYNVLGLTKEELNGVDQKKLHDKIHARIEKEKKNIKNILPKTLDKKIDEIIEKADRPNIFDFVSNRAYQVEYIIAHILEK